MFKSVTIATAAFLDWSSIIAITSHIVKNAFNETPLSSGCYEKSSDISILSIFSPVLSFGTAVHTCSSRTSYIASPLLLFVSFEKDNSQLLSINQIARPSSSIAIIILSSKHVERPVGIVLNHYLGESSFAFHVLFREISDRPGIVDKLHNVFDWSRTWMQTSIVDVTSFDSPSLGTSLFNYWLSLFSSSLPA